jgi:hypothetical protein
MNASHLYKPFRFFRIELLITGFVTAYFNDQEGKGMSC